MRQNIGSSFHQVVLEVSIGSSSPDDLSQVCLILGVLESVYYLEAFGSHFRTTPNYKVQMSHLVVICKYILDILSCYHHA